MKLRGLGEKKRLYLSNLNINSIYDLLHHYPKDYQDRRRITPLKELNKGENAVIKVIVNSVKTSGYSKKQTLIVSASDETGKIEIVFFNANFLVNRVKAGNEYFFYGKLSDNNKMLHPEIQNRDKLGLVPVYPLTYGISQNDLYKFINQCLDMEIKDYLSETVKKDNDFIGLKDALVKIHRPKSYEDIKKARERLIFDEFYRLLTGNKIDLSENRGISMSAPEALNGFISSLSFQLTDAQKRVIKEIEKDMKKEKIMNRLIQGDVGSGKTVVAAASAYIAIKSGYSVALMAPTEILARQHLKTMMNFFKNTDVKVDIISGKTTKKDRELILKRLKAGEVDLLIGTHALLQSDVIFDKLGLIISDEQHRFGVRQRESLTEKGKTSILPTYPDTLMMTATPIPRTLAKTFFSGLDISVIDELPKGRIPVETKVIEKSERKYAYKFIKEQVMKGFQAYVVAPLIESSDKIEAKSAKDLFDGMTKYFKDIKIGLIHGEMNRDEKDETMERFIRNEISILVATVVIEVGIDVKNANVIIIENSERFGLATLHQLRGRVGRGDIKSYCFLVNDKKEGISFERAKVMCETNDGFLIAEKDLELRGPGEFFGTRQHGPLEFKIADPIRDIEILEKAVKLC